MVHRKRAAALAATLLLLVPGVVLAQQFGELTGMARGKTDKADIHGFTEIYDHLFFPLRASASKVCEIGIAGGGSLEVWKEYFSKAIIYGIDFYTLDQLRDLLRSQGLKEDYLPAKAESDRLKTFVADQANRQQLQRFIDKFGGNFDIVLDDGGHTMEQQQVSLAFFFKQVKPGGYYVIEDVHTSLLDHYSNYGALKTEENTTLTMLRYFIRNGKIRSRYMRPEEVEYLNRQIDYCNLFVRNNAAHSMACIFRKKADGK
jgi:hypothetical protein